MFCPNSLSLKTFLVSVLLAHYSLAQSPTIVYPTTAAPTATPLPSAHGYTYIGCYNETTGVPGAGGARALSGGNSTTSNYLTPDFCLSFCDSLPGPTQYYAGLEYGRECYCGANLLAISEKLDDKRCDFACNGNSSEICGGRLALSLYNRTTAKEGRAWSVRSEGQAVWWYGILGVLMLVLGAAL